jgi:hypothetical protein
VLPDFVAGKRACVAAHNSESIGNTLDEETSFAPLQRGRRAFATAVIAGQAVDVACHVLRQL